MITKSEGYQTPDGEIFSTLEKAQAHFIAKLIEQGITNCHVPLAVPNSAIVSMAGSILAQKQAVIDCLTAK